MAPKTTGDIISDIRARDLGKDNKGMAVRTSKALGPIWQMRDSEKGVICDKT